MASKTRQQAKEASHVDSETNWPDFFLVGAMKAGTTAVHSFMQKHVRIFAPKFKEPFYFLGPEEAERVPPELRVATREAYLALYSDANPFQKKGDFSATYLWSRHAARLIHEHNPNAKIIVVLRNPIERAYSHYSAHVRDGFDRRPFRQAIEEEVEALKRGPVPVPQYISCGLYGSQIERYFEQFGQEAVLITFFDELTDEPLPVLEKMFAHIGAGCPDPNQPFTQIHKSGVPANSLANVIYKYRHYAMPLLKTIFPDRLIHGIRDRYILKQSPILSEEDRRRLREIFAKEIATVERLTGRDLSAWS
ncbi:MAG: sulfotransferase domain-containing protein [Alphaproteobacteria bacterium]